MTHPDNGHPNEGNELDDEDPTAAFFNDQVRIGHGVLYTDYASMEVTTVANPGGAGDDFVVAVLTEDSALVAALEALVKRWGAGAFIREPLSWN